MKWIKGIEHFIYGLRYGFDEPTIIYHKLKRRIENDDKTWLQNHKDNIDMQSFLHKKIIPDILRGVENCELVTIFNLFNVWELSDNNKEFEDNKYWLKRRMEYSGLEVHFDKLDQLDVIVFVIPDNFFYH